MASTTLWRASQLTTESITVNGEEKEAVRDFAVFIDTHRDQPHVGCFDDDIHRGTCKPTLVHLIPAGTSIAPMSDWLLWNAGTGQTLPLHEKHKFVSVDWWRTFLLDFITEQGEPPLDGKGFMPTSHLRDARKGKYKLRSFRQVVQERRMSR